MFDLAFGLLGKFLEKLGAFACQELCLAWGLQHILYDAKDVIEEIEYNALRRQAITAYGSTSTKIQHFFSSSMALPSDKAKIIEVIVISIDELGGLGKTTLAKLVYNDETVVNHFQLKMWISLRELDKRFLLVLDNVWNENRNKWVELIDLLNEGSHGSLYQKKIKCLSLFVKCVFKEAEDKQHPNLILIADEIVEKYKGVPLAMKSLVGQLYSKKQEFEDVEDLYIKELIAICFFQYYKEENFCLYSFKMRDLSHDLVLSVAHEEWLDIDSDKKCIALTIRYLSFSYNLTSVQTIIYQTKPYMSSVEACVSRFKYLRVLAITDSDCENLSSSISTQKHLRYLNLSNNESIKKLPNFICKLHSFQTLLLFECENFERLPKDIWNMICRRYLTNLQTFSFAKCGNLTCLPAIILHLTTLEILYNNECEEVDLKGGDTQDFNLRLQILHIEELPKLVVLPEWLLGSANALRHLLISDCENLKALPEWLPTLKSLQTLEITSCKE
ncbi:hypothetical protein I3842_10G111500 [Carya illinoinensis]|uniref:Disease resistance R13L4/SHOC-2-like LRR domain-containing protein n=1 Tax=Carya illinoinensis TaxID=32201 RepID=A0A922DX34_CARIL|nr:hypothetical protein I3842_10G111500 [Carya illinoinensis]